MRPSLPGKALVAVLLGFAALLWWWTGERPAANASRVPAAAAVPVPAAGPAASAMDSSAGSRVRAERWRNWKPEAGVRADPFAFVEATPSGPPAGLPPLVLQGISIDGERALAVVSRRIVGPGETVEGWKVTTIERETVVVTGPSGQFRLRFQREPERMPVAVASGEGEGSGRAVARLPVN